MFTKEILQKYANDLLFDLTDEEINLLLKEFDAINAHMEMINNIEGISKIEPMSYPQEISSSVLRNDEEESNLATSDVLVNSGDTIEDVIVVPKVVG